MKKNNLIILIVAMVIVMATAFKVTNAESTQAVEADNNPNHSMKRWANNPEDTKAFDSIKEEQSVAWFVAHSKMAREQNKACYDNPGIKSTPNCVNSLRALEISFAGASGR